MRAGALRGLEHWSWAMESGRVCQTSDHKSTRGGPLSGGPPLVSDMERSDQVAFTAVTQAASSVASKSFVVLSAVPPPAVVTNTLPDVFHSIQ